MAPQTLQTFLHSLHESACHQWSQFTAAALSQFGAENSSVHAFGYDVHLSNFLESFEKIRAKKHGTLDGNRHMHLTLPFSPDRRGTAQSKKIGNSATRNGVDSERGSEAIQVVHGEKILLTSNGNVSTEGAISNTRSVEQQSLQMELENKALLWTGPVSKEELGRATWTLLHTLAAQFPDRPTKQQQKDVKELMAILSRIYPCKECADHFKEVLKANPVQGSSGYEVAQWMCRVHNIVNRSLGKPMFPCKRVDARWGAMDCDEGACDLQGRMHR